MKKIVIILILAFLLLGTETFAFTAGGGEGINVNPLLPVSILILAIIGMLSLLVFLKKIVDKKNKKLETKN